MAFTLRHWAGVVVAGMALVAAWQLTLTPDRAPRPGREPAPPEVERRRELRHEVSGVRRALQQLAWVDSLAPLVAERAEDGLAVALPVTAAELAATDGVAAPEPAEPAERARARVDSAAALLEHFRRAVRLDADALGPRRADVLVGYVYQPMTHGIEPGTPYDPSPRSETYLGSFGGSDYCLQVRGLHAWQVSEVLREEVEWAEAVGAGAAAPGRTLGLCGFVARHGLPGPRVWAWLARGAVVMAMERREDPDATLPAGEGRLFRAVRLERRGAFGLRLQLGELPVEGCLSGKADRCASAFLDPGALFRTELIGEPGPAIRNFEVGWSPVHDLSGLLYNLEAELGREAFGRFWRSDLPVADAFESVTGVEPGPWVLAWMERHVGVEPSGPGLPTSVALGSLLAMGLLAGYATARQARRSLA